MNIAAKPAPLNLLPALGGAGQADADCRAGGSHPDHSRSWRGAVLTLTYLPLFFVPWAWRLPSAGHLWLSAAGIALFLVCHFLPVWRGKRVLPVTIVGEMLVAIALSCCGSWTVFAIYASASASAGALRPVRTAVAAIAACTAITILWALWLAQPYLWWLFGAIFMPVVGLMEISHISLKLSHAELMATRDEVRLLAESNERERIARDLHDTIGRTLTLIALKADLAERLLSRNTMDAQGEVRAIGATAREGLSEIRAALHAAHSLSLDREIRSAIAMLADAGVATVVSGQSIGVSGAAGSVLAMALREATTNIVRHAHARRAWITLAMVTPEPSTRSYGAKIASFWHGMRARDGGGAFVQLTVRDDGIGGDWKEGSGLSGMRMRLRASGGALAVQPGENGTSLIAAVPLA